MRPRFAALVAAGVLALSVAVGIPTAWAQSDPPAAGSPACDALVDADTQVLFATSRVTSAENQIETLTDDGASAADIAEAQRSLENARASLTAIRAAATDQLCGSGTGGTTPPAAGSPACDALVDADTQVLFATSRVTSAENQIETLTDDGASAADIAEAQRSLENARASLTAIRAAATDQLCGSGTGGTTTTTTTPSPTDDETVDPTADDDSDASTSGDQVTDVPVGSAQTGA